MLLCTYRSDLTVILLSGFLLYYVCSLRFFAPPFYLRQCFVYIEISVLNLTILYSGLNTLLCSP